MGVDSIIMLEVVVEGEVHSTGSSGDVVNSDVVGIISVCRRIGGYIDIVMNKINRSCRGEIVQDAKVVVIVI